MFPLKKLEISDYIQKGNSFLFVLAAWIGFEKKKDKNKNSSNVFIKNLLLFYMHECFEFPKN